MTCTPRLDADGKLVGWICGPGRYTHLVEAKCPWCCLGEERTIHAFREIYGGYCSPDMVCGTCGQFWTADDEQGPRRMPEEKRDENIALVKEMLDVGILPDAMPLPTALAGSEEGA